MAHLKSDGIVIFLDVDLITLESGYMTSAREVSQKDLTRTWPTCFWNVSFCTLKNADITIKCVVLNQEQACARIIERVMDKSRSQPAAGTA